MKQQQRRSLNELIQQSAESTREKQACPECGKAYSALSVHRMRAHGWQPEGREKCRECGTYCVSGSGMRRHMKEKHGSNIIARRIASKSNGKGSSNGHAQRHAPLPQPIVPLRFCPCCGADLQPIMLALAIAGGAK